ncbi:hypothetical protein THAOC_25140, partial [Thalassiosira oceanica]
MQIGKFNNDIIPFPAIVEGVQWTLQLYMTSCCPSIAKKSSRCLVYIMIIPFPSCGWTDISPNKLGPRSGRTQRAQQAWALLGAHTKSSTSLGPARGAHKELNKLGPRSGRTQRAQQAWAPLGAHTKSSTSLGPARGAHKELNKLGPRSVAATQL